MAALSRHLGFQLLGEYVFRHGAYLFINDLAVLENQQRRNATNAKFHRRLGVGVNVNFAHYYFAFVLAGKLFHHGAYHAAGAAPFGPEIDQYRLVAADDLIKVGVSYFNCFVSHYKVGLG